MGKTKKKNTKESVPLEPCSPSTPSADPREEADVVVPEAAVPESSSATPAPAPLPPIKSRFRRLLPDLIKVALALAVVVLGTVIWYKPPLMRDSFPYVSYTFGGKTATDARLYRPLAMPTRYYIELPKRFENRYLWFSVDRRREVAALTEVPSHRFLRWPAIKRSDPLGLDLEFRKLDHSEWQVHFLPDAIVFSNAVLAIRMDTKVYKSNTVK